MNFTSMSNRAFQSKCALFSIILIKIILLSFLLILCFNSFFLKSFFKNAQPTFWPTYSTSHSSNNIEILANIRLRQLQNTQNNENIQLVSSTNPFIPGTMDTESKKMDWTDKVALSISSTENSLKAILNIVDFAELFNDSSTFWSLIPASAKDMYDLNKSVMSNQADYSYNYSKNERSFDQYYH